MISRKWKWNFPMIEQKVKVELAHDRVESESWTCPIIEVKVKPGPWWRWTILAPSSLSKVWFSNKHYEAGSRCWASSWKNVLKSRYQNCIFIKMCAHLFGKSENWGGLRVTAPTRFFGRTLVFPAGSTSVASSSAQSSNFQEILCEIAFHWAALLISMKLSGSVWSSAFLGSACSDFLGTAVAADASSDCLAWARFTEPCRFILFRLFKERRNGFEMNLFLLLFWTSTSSFVSLFWARFSIPLVFSLFELECSWLLLATVLSICFMCLLSFDQTSIFWALSLSFLSHLVLSSPSFPFRFFFPIDTLSSADFTASFWLAVETSFGSFPLLFRVLVEGGGDSAFFEVNDDPVAVLEMLFLLTSDGVIVGATLSPDIPVLARLSPCNPLMLAPDDVGSFFSTFDFRNAVKGEDESVFSGVLALLSCLLRHDDVGFKSSTE